MTTSKTTDDRAAPHPSPLARAVTREIASIKRNSTVLKSALSALLVMAVVVLGAIELRHIDLGAYRSALMEISAWQKALIILFGFIAFLGTTVYDVLLKFVYRLPVSVRDTLLTGVAAQSFNNFINLGGLTGIKLRGDMMKRYEVPQSTALRVSLVVWGSALLGLAAGIIPALIVLSPLPNQFLWFLAIFVLYVPVYFLMGRGGDSTEGKRGLGRVFQRIFSRNESVGELSVFHRLLMLAGSVLEWGIGALYFAFVVSTLAPDVAWYHAAAVFLIAEAVGVLSFIPGGIGTFDVTAVALLTASGAQAGDAVAAILIFRLGYYIVPWLVGVGVVVRHGTAELSMTGRTRRKLARLNATLVAVGGVILMLSVATPAMANRMELLHRVFPEPSTAAARAIALLIGILMLILSAGLLERTRRAYLTAMVLLPAGAVFALMRGVDWEQTLILLFFAGCVYSTRRIYDRPARSMTKRGLVRGYFIAVTALVVYVVIHNWTHHVNYLNSDRRYSVLWVEQNTTYVMVSLLVLVAGTAFILHSRRHFDEFEPVTDDDITRFEKFIGKYEGNPFTFMYYMRDKSAFYNEAETVLFQYRIRGRNLIVLGDPIGEIADFDSAIDELLMFAERCDVRVSFYEVSSKYLSLYADQGFSFTKLGEDATVDLENFSLAGKSNRKLRNLLSRAERDGVTFEVIEPPFTSALLEELREISEEWLGGRAEMSFSLGGFTADYLNRAPVAVLRNEEGKITAFATVLPVPNSPVISIDLMRHSESRGAGSEMDLLFLNLMQWSKEKGYGKFYLGMAPLSNVGTKRYAKSKEKTLNLVYRFGNRFYSFQGLRAYKQKFHPRWSSAYLVYSGEVNLPEVYLTLLALVRGETTATLGDDIEDEALEEELKDELRDGNEEEPFVIE